MKACIKQGIGFTLCPEVSVQKELAQKTLLKLDRETGHSDISVIMIWHAEKWCSPLLKQFMEIAQTVIAEN